MVDHPKTWCPNHWPHSILPQSIFMRFLDSRAWLGEENCAQEGQSTLDFWRCVMALAINDTAPDFEIESTEGRIRFHDWIGNGWAVLFSHPKDFTPVCTTELGYMAKIKPEFD